MENIAISTIVGTSSHNKSSVLELVYLFQIILLEIAHILIYDGCDPSTCTYTKYYTIIRMKWQMILWLLMYPKCIIYDMVSYYMYKQQ